MSEFGETMPPSEPPQPPQTEFERTFQLFRERLLDPGREFRVLPRRSSLAEEVPQEGNPLSSIPKIEVFEKNFEPRTGDSTYLRPDSYTWDRWLTTAPEEVTTGPYEPTLNLRGMSHKAYQSWLWFRGGSPDARVWLGQNFIYRAGNVPEMASVLKYVIAQHAEAGRESGQLSVAPIMQAAILKSVNFVELDTDSLITRTVTSSLEALPSDLVDLARSRIYRSLGKAVVGAVLFYRVTRDALELAGTELLMRGIKMYDAAGLLDDKLWAHFGVQGIAALHTPAFGPMLRDKLAGPDGQRILQNLIARPMREGRAYITGVFTAYAKEGSGRNTANATRVLRQTHPATIKKGDNVDLKLLIQEANKLAGGYNTLIDSRGGDPEEKYAQLPDNPLFYADAFLRLLSIMREPDASPERRIEQAEQDTVHAEIVSLLFATQRRQPKLSRADWAVRFPDFSPQRIAVVNQLVSLGVPLREAVEMPFKEEP